MPSPLPLTRDTVLQLIESPDEISTLVLFVAFLAELSIQVLHKLLLSCVAGEALFKVVLQPAISPSRIHEGRAVAMMITLMLANNWALVRFTLATIILTLRIRKQAHVWSEQAIATRTSGQYWELREDEDEQAGMDFHIPPGGLVDNSRKLMQLTVLRRVAHSLRHSPDVQEAIHEFLETKDVDLLAFRIVQAAPRISMLQEHGNTIARRALRAFERAMTKKMIHNVERFVQPLPYGLDPGADPVMFGSVAVLYTVLHRWFFSLSFVNSRLSYLRGSTRFVFGVYLLTRFMLCVVKQQLINDKKNYNGGGGSSERRHHNMNRQLNAM